MPKDVFTGTLMLIPLPGYGGLLRGAFTIVYEMYMVLNPGILT